MPSKTNARKIHDRPQWYGLMQSATWDMKRPYALKLGYKPHAAQLEIHQNMARFKTICCGRRLGKTFLAAFESAFCALMGGWVMNAGPTYNLANKVWHQAASMIENSEFSDLITAKITQEGKQMIQLSTGGMIVAKSTDNPKSLVGDGWDFLVFDEAAKEASAEPWKRDLRPAIADRRGSALFTSTPMGDNWFKDLFDMGQSDQYKDYWSARYPSSANPLMTEEEIVSMCEGMTQDFINQEIYALFLGSGGSVFRTYHEVCDTEWQEEPNPDHLYCAGLDLGKLNDYTVLSIWDANANGLCHVKRLNLMPYPEIERIIYDELMKWKCPVIVDSTRESGTADRLRETCWFTRIENFVFSNESKSKIMNQLNLGFDEGVAHLLDQNTDMGRECYREFGAYKYERLPSGMLRMSAPDGKHDDIVCATALAYECNLRMMGITTGAIYRPQVVTTSPIPGQYTVKEMRNAVVGSMPRKAFRL